MENENIRRVIIHCPECGLKHIDREEWAKIPHRSHLCEGCGYIWRPFEFSTFGVEEV